MSFIATYQAKKNLIAQKLNEKGVEASGSEGLSSLIDKINNIEETVGEYSKTVTLTWNDNDNLKYIRPESVQVFLIREGNKAGVATLKPSNSWSYTFTELPYNTGYSIQGGYVEGYTATNNNLNVTYTIDTGHLYLNVSISGAPEGADLSALQMQIDGPDPSMPITIRRSNLTNGQYNFGQVIPGAYIVNTTNVDTLVEGYNINNSIRIADAVYLGSNENQTLSLDIRYGKPEEVEYAENPSENLGQLSFEILGPDERMPMTITYNQFTNGRFQLDDLIPGDYAVIERNAMSLIDGYYLTSSSITALCITVTPDGNSTAALFSQYAPLLQPEYEEEFVDIPISVMWDDNNNADLNRPESVIVRLYANGVEVDSCIIDDNADWSWTFIEKPIYDKIGSEINYTINIDTITAYVSSINNFSITNIYQPELTSVSVSVLWNDSNNSNNLRPSEVACQISNGSTIVYTAILSENNGWTQTVDNLSTIYNGSQVTYSWTFQEITSYVLDSVTTNNNSTTATYSITMITPPKPPKPPK